MTHLPMSYCRPTIDTLDAYEPGEQPRPGVDVLKLNTNENPYPPSPRAMSTLREVSEDQLRLYPHPYADEFRVSVGEVLDVDRDRVLVGNGSDDILTMLMRAVVDPSRSVAYAVPTYVLYRTLAKIQDARVVEVPFDDDYTLPLERLASSNTALTIVASPNSPSGNRIPNDALSELASRLDGVLAIDEAYVDFADENALALARRFENVIILRTLSKSHSLAGLRLGFAVASPMLIEGLAKVKDSYNVDAVAARVGAAAIRDTDYTHDTIARVRTSRRWLGDQLATLGYRVWPSEANFLLVRPPDGRAKDVYEGLQDKGILVRYFPTARLADKLRITVGTEADNERLVGALTALVQADG